MLVLSRKKGERIVVGGVISIEVADVRGDKVRLGIEAPKEIPVHRLEVAQAITKEGSPNVNGNVCPCCGK